jgi:hypothetical protein
VSTHTREQWLEAIEKAGGVTEGISKILGIHRTTVWRTAKAEPWIAEAIEDQQKVCLDIAMMKLREHIEDGNPKVIMWYLDRKGKELGFGRELKVDATVEQRAKVTLYFPDDGREARPDE